MCSTDKSTKDPKLWTMQFDGIFSTIGSGVGVVIISLEGCLYPFVYHLQFECTNNTMEYETLILGLKNAKGMDIKLPGVEGGAELVMK